MNPTTPKNLQREKDIAKAYQMRLDSYSFSQIAHELGVCKTSAFNYVKEAKEKYELLQENNLNYLRLMRIQQVERLIRSRLSDLAESEQASKDADSNDMIAIEDPEFGNDSQSEKNYQSRVRAKIIEGLLKLYQELSKLQGLYEYDRVDKYIIQKETHSEYDVDSLGLDELNDIFNDIQSRK